MTTTPKTPTTLQEAEAAEKAIAAFYLTRVQAAEAVMNSPEAQAFEAKVAELLADGLPAGTSCNVNLPRVAQWFAERNRAWKPTAPRSIASSILRWRLNLNPTPIPPTKPPPRRIIERLNPWKSSASSSPPSSPSASSSSSAAACGLEQAQAVPAAIRTVPTKHNPLLYPSRNQEPCNWFRLGCDKPTNGTCELAYLGLP